MKQIPLSNGGFAIVDDEDFDSLARFTWWRNNYGYAVRWVTISRRQQRMALLHREILGTARGEMVDHANGDPLDNRRANIRVCVSRENQRNMRKPRCRAGQPTTSRFKGVHWDRQTSRWRAKIGIEGPRTLHLGRFEDEIAAAKAYDVAATKYFGDFAHLNFST